MCIDSCANLTSSFIESQIMLFSIEEQDKQLTYFRVQVDSDMTAW